MAQRKVKKPVSPFKVEVKNDVEVDEVFDEVEDPEIIDVPDKKKVVEVKEIVFCNVCRQDKTSDKFIKTGSPYYKKISPMCTDCARQTFAMLTQMYRDKAHEYPEKDAMRRLCMMMDMFYSETFFNSVEKESKTKGYNFIEALSKLSGLTAFARYSYEDTLKQEGAFSTVVATIESSKKIDKKTIAFFGTGFSEQDYLFLKEQYEDWTLRHECNTKVQEEIFKNICFTQLELLKANRAGEDTKDLVATFQKLLDSANLQPKQNKNETASDSQTFGTLIDKWENTRPIPECSPELADVDGIGRYIDIFFKGHLAKMMGLKNGLSNMYTKFMEKYTVNKPEYNKDSDSEIIFDSIFGKDYE